MATPDRDSAICRGGKKKDSFGRGEVEKRYSSNLGGVNGDCTESSVVNGRDKNDIIGRGVGDEVGRG